MNKEWLRDKNVLIVGAESEISRYLAFNLILKYNCKIILVSSKEAKVKEFYEKIEEYQNSVQYFVFDTKTEKSWSEFANKLTDKTRVEILIFCTPLLTKFAKHDEISFKEVSSMMSLSLYTYIYCLKNILPYLKKEKDPAIINLFCQSPTRILEGTSSYNACNSAIKSYACVLANELEDKFYIANINLGFTKSDLEPYISNNSKLYKYAFSSNTASTKIINAIKAKKRNAHIGIDAKISNYLRNLFPYKTGRWLKNYLKRKNFSFFK